MKALLLHVGLSWWKKHLFVWQILCKRHSAFIGFTWNPLVIIHDFHKKAFVFTYFLQIIVVYRAKIKTLIFKKNPVLSLNLYENSHSFDMILMKAVLFHIAFSWWKQLFVWQSFCRENIVLSLDLHENPLRYYMVFIKVVFWPFFLKYLVLLLGWH